MTQLALLMGRTIRLPADDDASYHDTEIEFAAVTVDLSAKQAAWMGLEPPCTPDCPGCTLFGCCAAHDNRDKRKGEERPMKNPERVRRECAACGGEASRSGYAIHRDGLGEGPEVPLCRGCGSDEAPTCEQLWLAIAQRGAMKARERVGA